MVDFEDISLKRTSKKQFLLEINTVSDTLQEKTSIEENASESQQLQQ